MKRRYKSSLFHDIHEQQYSDLSRIKLYNSTKNSLSMVQRMCLSKRLLVHQGCVNSISWNETGEYILSGSDDQHIVVTNGYTHKVVCDVKTAHRANIFSAKFMPGGCDNEVVSCAGDGIILYTDLNCPEKSGRNQFNCHSGTTYEIITIPYDSHSFLSCGEDGTVRWFDLRQKHKCFKTQCKEDVLISCLRPVTTLAVNPTAPYQLAVGCSDSRVRLYDRRMLGYKHPDDVSERQLLYTVSVFTVPKLEERLYRITSLNFSPDGEELLVSFSSDHLYLFHIKDEGTVKLSLDGADINDCISGGAPPTKHPSPPVRRLRLRGDWSDTGPNARPEREGGRTVESTSEVTPQRPRDHLHATLMQRMTDVLSRMLNDPATRAALNGSRSSALGDTLNVDLNAPAPVPSTSTSSLSVADLSIGANSDVSGTSVTSIPFHLIYSDDNQYSEPTSDSNQSDGASQGLGPSQREHFTGSVDKNLDLPGTSQGRSDQALIDLTRTVDGKSPSDVMDIPPTSSSPNRRSTPVDIDEASPSGRLNTVDEDRSEETPSSSQRLTPVNETNLDDTSSPSQRLSPVNEDCNEDTPSLPQRFTNVNETSHGYTSSSSQRLTPEISQEDVSSSPSQRLALVSQATQTALRETVEFEPEEEEEEEEMEDGERSWLPQSQEAWFEDKYRPGQPTVRQTYMGHRNARTMIKEACFWGSDYVMSGSDCGHIFVWDRYTAKLVALLPGDQHVVNCLQPHPVLPLLATSGIDYDVKLWEPLGEEPSFDEAFAENLTQRNAVMLEETKDTITVPASFMIRMLACLNQIRRGGGRRSRRPEDED